MNVARVGHLRRSDHAAVAVEQHVALNARFAGLPIATKCSLPIEVRRGL
jgi:hypothetical protein